MPGELTASVAQSFVVRVLLAPYLVILIDGSAARNYTKLPLRVYQAMLKGGGMDFQVVAAAGGIALVDLVLSGDNALVIGAAASQLPRGQRLMAIFWGGIGAMVLRVALAIAATDLLQIPYLHAFGGIILLGIAIKILIPESGTRRGATASGYFFTAMATIILADLTMSLDNVLAVSALASGHLILLVSGLVLSMTLLFVASALIARLISLVPLLLDLAALVLGWTAANLVMEDHAFTSLVQLDARYDLPLHLGFLAAVLLTDIIVRLVAHGRTRARMRSAVPAGKRTRTT